MSAIEDVFTELMFGSGRFLGILLLETFVIGLMLKWKYSAVLLFPVTLFIGISYIEYDLLWEAIIMFSTTAFMVLFLMKEMKH